jgi:hypothetical protein
MGPPTNEELITDLFCDDPSEKLDIPDLSKIYDFNPSN